MLLFCFISAVVGIQLFMGLFRYRCMSLNTGVLTQDICGDMLCNVDYVCVKTTENPNYDNTSFDNFLYALLVVFQCITLEGWSSILQQSVQALGIYAAFFYIPVIFVGAFILIGLALAIIKAKFTQTMNTMEQGRV